MDKNQIHLLIFGYFNQYKLRSIPDQLINICLKYYGILILDSLILNDKYKHDFIKMITKNIDKTIGIKLLYRGSRDSFNRRVKTKKVKRFF